MEAVCTTPWTLGAGDTATSILPAMSPNWLLLVKGVLNFNLKGISSYGAALSQELYQYRRAIDTAMQYLPLENTLEPAVGFQLNGSKRAVRATTADTIAVYNIEDIE